MVVTRASDVPVALRQPPADFPKPKPLWIQILAVGSSSALKGPGWSLSLGFGWPAVTSATSSHLCTKNFPPHQFLDVGSSLHQQNHITGACGLLTKLRPFPADSHFHTTSQITPTLSTSGFFTPISGSSQEFAEPTPPSTNPISSKGWNQRPEALLDVDWNIFNQISIFFLSPSLLPSLGQDATQPSAKRPRSSDVIPGWSTRRFSSHSSVDVSACSNRQVSALQSDGRARLIFTSTEKKKSDLVECERSRSFKAPRPGDRAGSEVRQKSLLNPSSPPQLPFYEKLREKRLKDIRSGGRRRAGLLFQYFFLKTTGLRHLLSLSCL